ncbi:MAG: insulinase family protein [Bdellovibrionales bacterium CG10_big_fil_rev_8_21_14_0_10_45_34]|nr:MAG: insulinase family protein [Bdellovibrionales bacterium CG10_big_fil_rev_8_21_14_0_10_45_34]
MLKQLLVITSVFGLTPQINAEQNSALALRFPVEKMVLENGLTVLLSASSTSPIVSYQTWFRVGSRDEKEGLTGLAHLFEHLMFKGATRYSNKEFDQTIRNHGGSANAFTTRDYTGYYINFPNEFATLAVDLESDRMASLKFDEESLKSEREVVKEEKRFRFDNNPLGKLFNSLFEVTFEKSRYRWPVIGSMEDLDRSTLEDAKDFFSSFYSPSNAVIVVAGGFEMSKMKNDIKAAYQNIPRREVKRLAPIPEPRQKSPRSLTIREAVQTPHIAFSFRSPKAGGEDSHAMDILGAIIGEGEDSRLHRELVYKRQIATSVSTYNQSMLESGVFQTLIQATSIKSLATIASVYNSVVEQIRRSGVTQGELDRAKKKIMLDFVESLKTAAGKARALALNEVMLGDYEALFNDIEKYQKVDVKSIQASALAYLNRHQGVTIKLLPESRSNSSQKGAK